MNRSRCLLLAIALVGLVDMLAAGPRTPLQFDMPPASPVAGLSGDEGEFYQAIAPRLAAAAIQADTAATLGERRSRDLFAIRRAQMSLEDQLSAIDQVIAPDHVPARFIAAIERYQRGAAQIRLAIDEAMSAFTSFDWERLDAAVVRSRRGADELMAASQSLNRAAQQLVSPG